MNSIDTKENMIAFRKGSFEHKTIEENSATS
jgi:hypothetical protein